jgi:hypothetical protein
MNDPTPFGPILDYPERVRFVRRSPAFTIITRDGRERSVRPIDPLMLHRIMDRRVNLYERFAANDRYAPSAWDDEGITAALERDARGYEMIAMVGSALVLLLGIVAWVAL